jgi:uncharacterized protein DUF2171
VADPVSWFVMEPGWRVVDREGADVGTVDEILGDQNADIFDGLSVRAGALSGSRYVPSEHVAEITEGTVQLDLAAGEIETLDADPPGS